MGLKKLTTVLVVSAWLVLSIVPSSSAGQDHNSGSYRYGNPSNVGPWSKSVWENTFADFNGDGNIDFVSAVTKDHTGGNAPKLLNLGDGKGGFECSDLLPSSECYTVDAADYNLDGCVDLAVGNNGQNYLLINDGKGNFTAVEQFGKGNTVRVAWGDCDGDGLPDLAVANRSSDGKSEAQNYLYINQGDGRFKEVPEFGNPGSNYISWGDYNNDGKLDVAVANERGPNYLYVNMGKGHFKAVPMFGEGPTTQIVWGDYNKDGYLDAVVVNGIFAQEAILTGKSDCNFQNKLYTNDGHGGFTVSHEFGAGCSQSASWGDYNMDGKPDVAISHADKEHLPRLYINNGDGDFTEDLNNLPTFPDRRTGLWGARGVFQDINKDGVPEYLMAQY
jgi:hypothetical protein